jgi:hypothetical protein
VAGAHGLERRIVGIAAQTVGRTRACGLAVDTALSARKAAHDPRRGEGWPNEGTLSMWVFLLARLRTWVLLAIALPLARLVVHRLTLAADRRNPSSRTARALHQADSAVTAVSRRTSRRAARRRRRETPKTG